MNELQVLVKRLRRRLTEYRAARIGVEVSEHVNAVEIATCLTELALLSARKIREDEEPWFEAAYYVSMVLSGSEWEDIEDDYALMCDLVHEKGFFRA